MFTKPVVVIVSRRVESHHYAAPLSYGELCVNYILINLGQKKTNKEKKKEAEEEGEEEEERGEEEEQKKEGEDEEEGVEKEEEQRREGLRNIPTPG